MSSFSIRLTLWVLSSSVLVGCYVEVPQSAPEVVVARLGELLADPDPNMRRTAAEALGKIGLPSASSGLRSALNDRDPRVRAVAALSLGRLGDGTSDSALVARLSDSAEPVRAASALALGEVASSPATEVRILQVLRQAEGLGHVAASRALLGLERVSYSTDLVDALRDPDPLVRQGIVAALGESGDVRAVPYLLSLVRKDAAAGVRAEAAFRLGKIGDDRVKADLAAVADADSDATVRGWARWAMQQIRQSRVTDSER
jgi:HEAT repeat protein